MTFVEVLTQLVAARLHVTHPLDLRDRDMETLVELTEAIVQAAERGQNR